MATRISGYDPDLATQMGCLREFLLQNPVIVEVLKRTPDLGLPNWHLGAGCIAQTVWNAPHEFAIANPRQPPLRAPTI